MSTWINPLDLESTLGHKILIAGLQEAGKTAIKRVFFLKQKAVDVDNLKATIDYERMQTKINNVPLTVVDLGGQRIFIKRFLNSFSPFIFNNVKILIFVIDVSVKSTRNNAVQYFSSCIEKINEYSRNADIFVFLHKNDLTRHLPNYESVHNQLKEQFQLECNKKVTFFRTTIFDPDTIINAFGRMFELSIPAAARGKLVEGRSVSVGEEFAKKFAVQDELEMEKCPFCDVNLFRTPDGLECNICGYKPRRRLEIKDEEPASKPKISVEDLQNQLNKVRLVEKDRQIPTSTFSHEELIEQEKIFTQRQERERQRIAETKKYISQVQREQSLQPQDNILINHGFSNDEAEKIQNSEYSEFFSFSVNFGLSLEFLRKILSNYIPKMIPSNLKLSNPNIFGILSTFKSGIIKENEILKLLYFNQEFPDLTVEELIWNNFPDVFAESPKDSKALELEKESLDEDIILLSFKENIGVKINPKEYNVDLFLYQGRKKFDQLTVPYDILEKDLKYLFIFEIKLPVKDNLQEFVKKAVEIILNELILVKPEKKEEEAKKEKERHLSDEGILIENQDINYNILIQNSTFELSFTKQDRNFGKLTGSLSITAPELFHDIKNKTLIATLVDDDDLMFASLELFNKIEKLTK